MVVKRSRVVVLGVMALMVALWAAFGRTQTTQVKPPYGQSRIPLSQLKLDIASRVQRAEAAGMRNTISGRVLGPDGDPAPNALVIARFRMHQTGAPGEGSALTGEDGKFVIRGLGQNDFMVGPARMDDYVVPPPVNVNLQEQSSATVGDFKLVLGPQVTVKVTDAETHEPVEGLSIELGDLGMSRRTFQTDAKGTARFRADVLEFEMNVRDSIERPRISQAPGHPLGHQVKLDRPMAVEWNLLVYRDNAQGKPAVFRGVVVDDADKPVSGANVTLHRYNDHIRLTTNAKGEFAAETFRIAVYEDPQRAAAVTVTKGDQRAFRVVTAEETWNGIRMVLGTEKPGVVRGRVVDEHGQPLSACRFTYWETFGIAIGSVGPDNTYYTNADGTFELKHLHPGAYYTFGFGDFYEGNRRAGSVHIPEFGSAPMTMTEQGIDLGTVVVPRADRTVGGRVVQENGKLNPSSITILLKGKYTSLSTSPNAAGVFRFEGVVDEPLTLSVFSGNRGVFRTGKDSPDRLLDRKVARGENSMVIKYRMRPALP